MGGAAVTAHRTKPTITPERIEWFARYYTANPSWGEFHVALDDGNYKCEAGPHHPTHTAEIRATWPADLRDAAEWFDTLTPSQRRRLAVRAKKWCERWAALFDSKGRLTEWTRCDGYGDIKFTATRTTTVGTNNAAFIVVRNGLGHEVKRVAVRA